ncbi:hypothetical protein ABIQ69_16100 [Agromyces sp. G08B096]|uniref:DUF559 domain-containing protein n=1 Tax=Agromyces sp. G08B096 TaxID=3156399 RepID=A0AAU7W884_9MICO
MAPLPHRRILPTRCANCGAATHRHLVGALLPKPGESRRVHHDRSRAVRRPQRTETGPMTVRAPLPDDLRDREFTVAAAAAAGVSAKRLRASDLVAPTSGVRMPRAAGIRERRRAVLLAVRADAFLCGVSAAQEHGLPMPWRLRDTVEVGVPWPARAPRRSGVVARSLRITGDEVECRGIRLTSPARTFCDLAPRLSVPELVAVADAIPPWVDLSRAAAEHPGARFRGKLATAVAARDCFRESPAESEMFALILLAGLPRPTPQVVIADRGRFIARVDGLFEPYGEVLEYQGDHHRTDLRQWRRDRTREAELEALGFHVTEVTQADLREPRAFVERLAASLRRRGWTGSVRYSRWFPEG